MVNNRGFSLVEVLIAMVILTSVILVGSSAFSMFSQKWNGQLGKYDSNLNQIRVELLIQDVLQHIIPYVALDQNDIPVLYFEGNQNGFVAVSRKSVMHPELPAVVRVSAKQNLDDFSFSILYEEWPMKDRLLMRSGVALPFEDPYIIGDGFDNVTFEYFGTPKINAIERAELGRPEPRWTNSYNSLQTQKHPLKVRFIAQIETYSNLSAIDLIQPSGTVTSLLSVRFKDSDQPEQDDDFKYSQY